MYVGLHVKYRLFFISSFRRVLYVVSFILGNYTASGVYMPTFRNTMFHLHMQVDVSRIYSHLPAYEDGTECSETSAYKLQTPGNYPKERIQHTGYLCQILMKLEFSLQRFGKKKKTQIPKVHALPSCWIVVVPYGRTDKQTARS